MRNRTGLCILLILAMLVLSIYPVSARVDTWIDPGATLRLNQSVAPGHSYLLVNLTWLDPRVKLDLTIYDPAGNFVRREEARGTNGHYNTQITVKILNPAEGIWIYSVTNENRKVGTDVHI